MRSRVRIQLTKLSVSKRWRSYPNLVEHAPLEQAARVAVPGVDRVDGEVVPLDAIDDGNCQSPAENNNIFTSVSKRSVVQLAID